MGCVCCGYGRVEMNGHSTSPDVDARHDLSVDRLTGQRRTSASTSSGSSDVIISSPSQHAHRGPQPISPPPPSPQISAADLLLLTEASATHNGTFQCTLCSKQFGYKNGLIRHVRLTHVGEKPYQCSICNRRFGYKHILMEHQNLHFGNRPYACHLCDKRFAARSNLIQHRMVHRRPHSCPLCSKRFDREDQLKKHLFAHPQSHVGGLGAGAGPAVDSPSSRETDDDKTADNADRPSPNKSPRLSMHQQQQQQQASYPAGVTSVFDETVYVKIYNESSGYTVDKVGTCLGCGILQGHWAPSTPLSSQFRGSSLTLMSCKN